MPIDDDVLFYAMMEDVIPLNNDTAEHNYQFTQTQAHKIRQQAAVSTTQSSTDYLSLDNAELIKPEDIISYKKAGIQEGVFKKLRLGKYPIQARLDLHRKSLSQARDEVLNFIERCVQFDLRTVLIVHGKGIHANPPALLKSYVANWITHIPQVMCAHSCLPHHGGNGAIYLLLRKSEAKKQETREHIQKRLG